MTTTVITPPPNVVAELQDVPDILSTLKGAAEITVLTHEPAHIKAELAPPPVIQSDMFLAAGPAGPPGPPGTGGGGSGSGLEIENVTLTQPDVARRGYTLAFAPADPSKITLVAQEGPPQFPGVDFIVTGRELSWNALALELLVTVGTRLQITYPKQ